MDASTVLTVELTLEEWITLSGLFDLAKRELQKHGAKGQAAIDTLDDVHQKLLEQLGM